MSVPVSANSLARGLVPSRVRWLEAPERAAGLVLLLATAPITLLASLIVAGLSRRSPLVAHLRVGQDGALFWMLKLRTMWTPEPPQARERGWMERIVADPPGDSKEPADQRVTSRFAAFCRCHSIDELPQLWHVARGEMSLVGPRPLTQGEIARYAGVHAGELLSWKPGLTGLWQVSGRSRIPFPRRMALDLEMVRSLTPAVYCKILWRTLPELIWGRGAW